MDAFRSVIADYSQTINELRRIRGIDVATNRLPKSPLGQVS
jgi:hypothetical protein